MQVFTGPVRVETADDVWKDVNEELVSDGVRFGPRSQPRHSPCRAAARRVVAFHD